jgi:hypothetical protein
LRSSSLPARVSNSPARNEQIRPRRIRCCTCCPVAASRDASSRRLGSAPNSTSTSMPISCRSAGTGGKGDLLNSSPVRWMEED